MSYGPADPGYGAPLPPGAPYGGYPPPRRPHTTRNVVTVVLTVLVLFCGGGLTLVGLGVFKASQAIHDIQGYPGGINHPITVSEGQAFSIKGTDYAAGWTIDDHGSITGLRATDHRSDGDGEQLHVRFSYVREAKLAGQDDPVAGYVICDSDLTVYPGKTIGLSCADHGLAARRLTGVDRIEVHDEYPDFD